MRRRDLDRSDMLTFVLLGPTTVSEIEATINPDAIRLDGFIFLRVDRPMTRLWHLDVHRCLRDEGRGDDGRRDCPEVVRKDAVFKFCRAARQRNKNWRVFNFDGTTVRGCRRDCEMGMSPGQMA